MPSLACPLTLALTHSPFALTRPLTRPLAHPLAHPLTPPLACPPPRPLSLTSSPQPLSPSACSQGFFRSLPIYFSIHVGLLCPPSLSPPLPLPLPLPLPCPPPSHLPSPTFIHPRPSPLALCLALTHPLCNVHYTCLPDLGMFGVADST